VFEQLKRLARHSAIYGLGGIVSRILAVFLLPLYTAYLDPSDFGAVGVMIAMSAVLVTIFRGGISSAFFRFYFDSPEHARRLLVLRTSFWYTMTSATVALVAGALLAQPIADLLGVDDPWLVRAAFVGVWAQMNYEQLTSLFRVEERSQLGLQLSRPLLREMQRFGWPLVPAALALIAVNFSDRFFLSHLSGLAEVGKYELGVRIASAEVLLLTAFRTAWPAFAYSIEDDDEAKRTYSYVLTYLVFIASWLALGLAALSPWLVRILASNSDYYEGSKVVGLLAFGTTAYAAYIVMAIGVGRARRTQFNWVITGMAAIVNLALNVALIPPFGMVGAAIATLASYVVLFLGMTYWAQRVYPTPYQWRRVATAVAGAVALAIVVKLVDAPLALAFLIAVAYPVVLVPLGFYLPAERRRFRALLRLS
jgi:O-antigen/teichoic acid export membrane protein